MARFGPTELIIVLVIVILVFGVGRLGHPAVGTIHPRLEQFASEIASLACHPAVCAVGGVDGSAKRRPQPRPPSPTRSRRRSTPPDARHSSCTRRTSSLRARPATGRVGN